jgi:hypothetical protein
VASSVGGKEERNYVGWLNFMTLLRTRFVERMIRLKNAALLGGMRAGRRGRHASPATGSDKATCPICDDLEMGGYLSGHETRMACIRHKISIDARVY